MPTGLARWRDKLFITIPRWKTGVPSSLNYVYLNSSQASPLRPYPSWKDAYVRDSSKHINTNATVVSAFRTHVDKCDRLWVVDNGVVDMSNEAKQIADPAILVFDLNDKLLVRKDLMGDVLEESSVLTSIVVDLVGKGCDDAYAYITDMGASSIIVFSLKTGETWRVQNHYFLSDPQATTYKVGGVEFCWCDGVSSAAISGAKCDGSRDLYVHPTSSTRQYKLSTKLLRDKKVSKEEIFSGVQMVLGDKGPMSQTSACDYDQKNNILFFTQICKNAIGCWDTDKPLTPDSLVTLVKDCNLLEFPNDIKVDNENNVWILSNRQSRFLNNSMDFSQVNFRVLTAPAPSLVQGTACQRAGHLSRVLSALGSKRHSQSSSKGQSCGK